MVSNLLVGAVRMLGVFSLVDLSRVSADACVDYLNQSMSTQSQFPQPSQTSCRVT